MLLNVKLRKRILNLPYGREISNWIVNKKNSFFYLLLTRKFHHDKIIGLLKDTAKGDRCFIVGNGPSLSMKQLDLLRNEVCFGANRIYKVFEQTDWRPDYYVIQDPYDITKGVYENLEVKHLFVSDYYWRKHGMKNLNSLCYHIKRELRQTDELPFSEDISKYIQAAATVTFSMIQIAVYLGYKEIYLIGMDHTYANHTDDRGNIIKQNSVKNHLFEDEKPNEVVANISYMESAYKSALNYCKAHNIKIYNATIGGALEVFERVDFWALFGEQNR